MMISALYEQFENQLELTTTDAAWIAQRFSSKISIAKVPGHLAFSVNPHQYVGVLTLPSGVRFEIKPKVPVSSLFYMMAVALRRPDLEQETAKFQKFDELLEFIASYFADLVTARLDQGLYRSYLE